jgi:hypothetical protein
VQRESTRGARWLSRPTRRFVGPAAPPALACPPGESRPRRRSQRSGGHSNRFSSGGPAPKANSPASASLRKLNGSPPRCLHVPTIVLAQASAPGVEGGRGDALPGAEGGDGQGRALEAEQALTPLLLQGGVGAATVAGRRCRRHGGLSLGSPVRTRRWPSMRLGIGSAMAGVQRKKTEPRNTRKTRKKTEEGREAVRRCETPAPHRRSGPGA